MLLWPGRWLVVWSQKWRRLRRSLALACPRNCWPLYSTPSPMQPALHRVPEPRWLLRSLRQKPLVPGGPLCSHQEGGWLSGVENGAASEALWLSPVPETAGLCIPHPHRCSLPSAESRNQGGSRWSLRQKPLGPGGPLCSHQEGGQLSGAEDGAASEALWLLPGRWPVIWSRRWRRLRSSVALACPRNCWPLYSRAICFYSDH